MENYFFLWVLLSFVRFIVFFIGISDRQLDKGSKLGKIKKIHGVYVFHRSYYGTSGLSSILYLIMIPIDFGMNIFILFCYTLYSFFTSENVYLRDDE